MNKILVLSGGDINGAYEVAYRIAKFLHDAGYKVAMLVKEKTRTDEFITRVPDPPAKASDGPLTAIFTRVLQKTRLLPVPAPANPPVKPEYIFYAEETLPYISGKALLSHVGFTPELVIAAITYNFVNTDTLAEVQELTHAKIYFAMADMFLITGGCHYAWDCRGYESDCRNCPAIVHEKDKDWAHRNLLLKKKNILAGGMQILAMSGWTLEQAKRSFLFRDQKEILNINSCIDTKLFNNKSRSFAKSIFNLPEGAKVVFIGSQNIKDERKGVIYAIVALDKVWAEAEDDLRENVYVLLAGREVAKDEAFTAGIPFKKHYIDYITDYRLLALAYQAADVFICSSIEDSGPMMVSEALACGTPVAGFEMGVVSNMVVNGYNGYKAELKDTDQLAEGIHSILKLDAQDFKRYSDNAVLQVEKYSSGQTVIDAVKHILSN